jgi:hypothetical protein
MGIFDAVRLRAVQQREADTPYLMQRIRAALTPDEYAELALIADKGEGGIDQLVGTYRGVPYRVWLSGDEEYSFDAEVDGAYVVMETETDDEFRDDLIEFLTEIDALIEKMRVASATRAAKRNGKRGRLSVGSVQTG